MSSFISLIKNAMAKKKAEVVIEDVVETVVTKEETVATPERDEAFHKAHTGAQDNVIYG